MSTGLSRTDRITAIYNAVSLTHLLPVGGEDVYRYDGLLTLDRANGAETFDTISYGVAVTEHPSPGEVIWRDLSGVRQTPGCDTSWTNPRSGSGKLAKSVTPTTVSPPTGSGRRRSVVSPDMSSRFGEGADHVEELQLFYSCCSRWWGEPQQALSAVLAEQAQAVQFYFTDCGVEEPFAV